LPVGIFQPFDVSIIAGAVSLGQKAVPAVFFVGDGGGVSSFVVGWSVAGGAPVALGVRPWESPRVEGVMATVGASLVSPGSLGKNGIGMAYDVMAVLVSHFLHPVKVSPRQGVVGPAGRGCSWIGGGDRVVNDGDTAHASSGSNRLDGFGCGTGMAADTIRAQEILHGATRMNIPPIFAVVHGVAIGADTVDLPKAHARERKGTQKVYYEDGKNQGYHFPHFFTLNLSVCGKQNIHTRYLALSHCSSTGNPIEACQDRVIHGPGGRKGT